MGESREAAPVETPESEPATPGRWRVKPSGSRIPERSQFYTRWMPALIIALGVLMVLLIIVAAGVLLGFVPFR